MSHIKNSFSFPNQDQLMALNDFKDAVANLTVHKGQSQWLPWQHGVTVTSTAVPLLYEDLRKEYGIKSIMTSRLNQDGLENIFSQLRYAGGADSSFGALAFRRLLRNFILGAGQHIPISKFSAVEEGPKEELITKNLIPKDTDIKAAKVCQVTTASDDVEEIIDLVDINETLQVHFEVPVIDQECSDISEDLPEPEWKAPNDHIPPPEKLDTKKITKEEGYNYYGGYLCYKSNDRSLIKRSRQVEGRDEEFVASQWISLQNYGGLCIPSITFVEDLKEMNTIFEDFHGSSADGLLRTKNIISDLTKILESKFSYDRKLLRRFVMSRTMFRLRHLQRQLCKAESKRSKMKKIQFAYSQ